MPTKPKVLACLAISQANPAWAILARVRPGQLGGSRPWIGYTRLSAHPIASQVPPEHRPARSLSPAFLLPYGGATSPIPSSPPGPERGPTRASM